VQLPLDGIKVLDLTRVLAGPVCTMLLGDLGADVIKVERQPRGDDTREWGPPFDPHGESAYYLSVNRNKLSIAADLRAPADRDVIVALIGTADVVVENFLPGALERLGVGARDEITRNSKLIWCSITGFGADSRRPGYDFIVQAESGWMAITGDPEGEPMKSGVALGDVIAGKDAAAAILAALVGRSRGVPITRHLVISLVDSARAALVNVAQNAMVSGTEARRWGNAHANLVPYQLFQASDRAIVIAVGTDEQWVSCARALGLEGLGAESALATNRGRLEHRDRVVRSFQGALGQRPAAEWLEKLASANVPCGVVKTVLEAVRDAGVGPIVMGMPSAVGGSARLPPPRLDEHGPQIRAAGWEAFRSYR
jgi:crotonobetainyl-CoA:carnitine CoA-transferase CaiB-like acyl-CoA transferase